MSVKDETTRAAEAANRFTVDLFRGVAGAPGDVFASPLNVATALGMTAVGARGETARQIARALHLSDEADADSLGELAEAVRGAIHAPDGDDAAVSTANAAWFDPSESILPEYARRLHAAFGAEPRRADFRHAPTAARELVNRWAADATHGKIRDLLKPRRVGPDTSFVLASAIYFKGYWTFPFDPKLTRDDVFHAPGGDVPARLMFQSAKRLPHRQDDEAQVVALPYKDGSLSMLVVLPKKPDGLPALEAGLTAEKIQTWAMTTRPAAVNLTLPRFQSTAEVELKDALSGLGMVDAFEPSKADFSGINGRRDLYLSAVVHKALVEVDEQGTEAAAAAAAVGARHDAVAPPPIVFRADRPFLYMIRDAGTGAILFIGRLERP